MWLASFPGTRLVCGCACMHMCACIASYSGPSHPSVCRLHYYCKWQNTGVRLRRLGTRLCMYTCEFAVFTPFTHPPPSSSPSTHTHTHIHPHSILTCWTRPVEVVMASSVFSDSQHTLKTAVHFAGRGRGMPPASKSCSS